MKKLLCWLLLLLLPLLGLFVAQALVPPRKPSWTLNSASLINVLGCVEDGQTLLVRDLYSTGLEYLLGLDTETGRERFRIPMAGEFLVTKPGSIQQAKLSADGKHVVLLVMGVSLPFPSMCAPKPGESQVPMDRNVSRQHVVFYDWKQQQVAKVIQTQEGFVSPVSSSGDFLVRSVDQLSLFNISEPGCLKTIPITTDCYDAQLSPTGRIACFNTDKRFSGGGFVTRIQLVDLHRGKLLNEIPARLHDVQWPEDSQSITGICLDTIKNSLTKYRFTRQGDEFVVDSNADHHFQVIGNVLPDQHFTAIATTVKEYTWRTKMDREIGGLATSLLDRFWPNAQVLLLYDRQSSELKHKLILPLGHKALTSFQLNTHPSGKSLALWDGRFIQYWDLYPFSRWYPLFGLLVGTVIAAILGWKVLKVRTKKPVPGTP